MATSRKRKTSATEDDDTREVKRRDTSASPSTSHDYCESPPAAVPLPWDDDEDDDDDDDDFEFSPASPPLIQTTKREEEEEEETTPPTLYVFPDSTVLLTADGGAVRIPDRPANQPESSTREDSPEPSTSHTYASHMNTEVCKIMIEESVSHIITNTWRTSSQTLEEVTTSICESITATIMSPECHELMKSYARINIRRLQ